MLHFHALFTGEVIRDVHFKWPGKVFHQCGVFRYLV